MKVKTLSRSTNDYLPSSSGDVRLPRNLHPALHPHERAREYTRALNATKLERMFAAPFIAQMGHGHVDGVYTTRKNPRRLEEVASGSGDGEVSVWNMADQSSVFTTKAHQNIVKGLCWTKQGKLLSCATDQYVKLWDPSANATEPVKTYLGSTAFNSIDHHRNDDVFATAAQDIQIWDEHRSDPVSTLSWGAETVNAVRFNQTETSVLASAGSDRTLILYDIRTSSPLSRLITQLRTNAIAWNPMEAFNFATACEDHNVYIFDMRKLNRALNVLKDHVAAVMDVDFSPTGEELVTGSYDRTIRLYKRQDGHSRDIYHTKRMQRVFAVQYSMDSRYIISGSDDGNVRLWRAQAASRSNIRSARERAKLEYDETLKERYMHIPEIRRIARQRHIPKAIKKTSQTKKIEEASIKRREDNVRRHSKKGAVPFRSERDKMVFSHQQ